MGVKSSRAASPPPGSNLGGLTYRPEIDGLRAIAVVLVILYHAFPDLVTGGFIGVDVFFVISGYLISRQILSELGDGTFTFRAFFVRRVRRIFPAMLLVTAAVFVAGWFLLYDDEFSELGGHVFSAMTFSNNLNLIRESGYFDRASEAKPMLHFWSLAVEEQFYLLWPAALYLVWRHRKSAQRFILFAAGLSFVFALVMGPLDPVKNFFLPFGRFWEMLFGASLAARSVSSRRSSLNPERTNMSRKRPETMFAKAKSNLTLVGAEALSLSGLGVLLVSAIRFGKSTTHPSFPTLLPVVATTAVLIAGGYSRVNKVVLGNQCFRWIGLISYPLYLWHWPLLSFSFIASGRTPPLEWRLSVLVLSLVLAVLTVKWVESRYRGPRFSRSDLRVLISATLVLALLGSVSSSGAITTMRGHWSGTGEATEPPPNKDGVKGDANEKQLSSLWGGAESMLFEVDLAERPQDRDECLRALGFDNESRIRYCEISSLRYPVRVGVVGDSHAAATYSGLAEQLKEQLHAGSILLAGRPFVTVEAYPVGDDEERRNSDGGREAIEFIADSTGLSTVVIIARGFFYLDWAEHFVYLPEPSLAARKEVFLRGMKDTLDRLSSKDVIFVLEVPTLDFDPRRCETSLGPSFSGQDCRISRDQDNLLHSEYLEAMRQLTLSYTNVTLVNPRDVLCTEAECFAFRGGKPLYDDNNHLSPYGALIVGDQIVAAIRAQLERDASWTR